MFHELTTITCLPRRRAQLVVIMEKLMPIWEKNGIRVVGMWATYIGRSEQFVYMLEWESLADREEKWAKFTQDPDMLKVFEGTDPIAQFHDSVILQPIAYSPKSDRS